MKKELQAITENHSNMVAWQAVISLLEGSLISTNNHAPAQRVIKIAVAERQKYFRKYQAASLKIGVEV